MQEFTFAYSEESNQSQSGQVLNFAPEKTLGE